MGDVGKGDPDVFIWQTNVMESPRGPRSPLSTVNPPPCRRCQSRLRSGGPCSAVAQRRVETFRYFRTYIIISVARYFRAAGSARNSAGHSSACVHVYARLKQNNRKRPCDRVPVRDPIRLHAPHAAPVTSVNQYERVTATRRVLRARMKRKRTQVTTVPADKLSRYRGALCKYAQTH